MQKNNGRLSIADCPATTIWTAIPTVSVTKKIGFAVHLVVDCYKPHVGFGKIILGVIAYKNVIPAEPRGDSNSIRNQKMLLQKYADENRLRNIKFYVDDGYSGSNFDRPFFTASYKCAVLLFVVVRQNICLRCGCFVLIYNGTPCLKSGVSSYLFPFRKKNT